MLDYLNEVFLQLLCGGSNLGLHLKLVTIEFLLEENCENFDDPFELGGGVSDVKNARIELCEDR